MKPLKIVIIAGVSTLLILTGCSSGNLPSESKKIVSQNTSLSSEMNRNSHIENAGSDVSSVKFVSTEAFEFNDIRFQIPEDWTKKEDTETETVHLYPPQKKLDGTSIVFSSIPMQSSAKDIEVAVSQAIGDGLINFQANEVETVAIEGGTLTTANPSYTKDKVAMHAVVYLYDFGQEITAVTLITPENSTKLDLKHQFTDMAQHYQHCQPKSTPSPSPKPIPLSTPIPTPTPTSTPEPTPTNEPTQSPLPSNSKQQEFINQALFPIYEALMLEDSVYLDEKIGIRGKIEEIHSLYILLYMTEDAGQWLDPVYVEIGDDFSYSIGDIITVYGYLEGSGKYDFGGWKTELPILNSLYIEVE